MAQEPISATDDQLFTHAIIVDADKSRWGELAKVSANQVWTKVSQKDTGDAWSMFESRVPAGLAVPLHQHLGQEEWFWALEGKFVFEVGGDMYRLTPGTSLLAPRRIPHRWKKTGESDGRLLILVQPAAGMEEFFRQFAQLSAEQQQDRGLLTRLFAECDMELLGPPFDESVG